MFLVGLFIVPSAEFIFFASDSLNCAASIVRARYYTNQIQSDCFEYTLKFLLKSSYQKCLNIFLIFFFKFSYPQRKPVMKNFKTKKKSLYHLPSPISLTLPYPPTPPPPPRTSLGSNFIVCAVFFIVGSSSTFLPLPLFVLVSVSLEIS